jgi:hypothetical protein
MRSPVTDGPDIEGMEQRPLLWLWLALFALTIGCRAEIHPVTTGSFKALPSPGERVLVEGSELGVVNAVAAWLEDRGLIVIAQKELRQDMGNDTLRQCGEDCFRTAMIERARALGADELIFTQSSRLHAPDRLAVSLQGLAVRTGENLWNASGQLVIPHTALNEQQITQELATVACHALATVWGYRPAGGLTTESSVDFCHLQNYYP